MGQGKKARRVRWPLHTTIRHTTCRGFRDVGSRRRSRSRCRADGSRKHPDHGHHICPRHTRGPEARRRPVTKFGAVWCRKKPSRLNVRACIYWCRGTELNCRHGDFQSFDTVLYFKELQIVRTKYLGANNFSTPVYTLLHIHLARFWAITHSVLWATEYHRRAKARRFDLEDLAGPHGTL